MSDVSFSVAPGTTHALVGESGSGKTTTGRAISLFSRPTAGSIALHGEEITTARGKHQRELRRAIQMVYQNPFGSLDPRLSIGDSIAEPVRNFFGASRRSARAIARAIIIEPELIVLDEAVSALDVTVQAQILRLLDDLQKELGLTYIFISHDLAVVNQISDSVSVLSRGKQVEYGATEKVFTQPSTDYTRTLIDAIPGSRYRAGDLNLGL